MQRSAYAFRVTSLIALMSAASLILGGCRGPDPCTSVAIPAEASQSDQQKIQAFLLSVDKIGLTLSATNHIISSMTNTYKKITTKENLYLTNSRMIACLLDRISEDPKHSQMYYALACEINAANMNAFRNSVTNGVQGVTGSAFDTQELLQLNEDQKNEVASVLMRLRKADPSGKN